MQDNIFKKAGMEKLEQMRGEIPSKHCSSYIDIDLKYVLFKKKKK